MSSNYSMSFEELQEEVSRYKSVNGSVGELSDSCHTFNELYHHRSLLFLSLCITSFKSKAWKSLLHHDNEKDPMYSGMFIMGIDTPYGQASYHFDIDPYWSMSKGVKELDRAPEFDGHTPDQAIERIFKYAQQLAAPTIKNLDDEMNVYSAKGPFEVIGGINGSPITPVGKRRGNMFDDPESTDNAGNPTKPASSIEILTDDDSIKPTYTRSAEPEYGNTPAGDHVSTTGEKYIIDCGSRCGSGGIDKLTYTTGEPYVSDSTSRACEDYSKVNPSSINKYHKSTGL